jgi:protein-S-isoprenylcysteine O-methyltransferase Ste14
MMEITPTASSWPAVIIGVIVGIYWLKVLQLVARTKRTVGRAANFVPPEKLGRVLRFVWIPVVVLWIFLPMLTPFIGQKSEVSGQNSEAGLPWVLQPVSFTGSAIVGWTAVAVAVVAFAITWVCWIKMGTSWRMGIDPDEKTKLVFNGPYAYVRHPIYGLSQVLMIAALCALPSPLMLVITVLHLALMQWEVRREEKYLVQLHGPSYGDYMRKVGRFVPRITRWR